MTEYSINLVELLPATVKRSFIEADEHSQQTLPVVDFGLSSTQLIEFIMRIESTHDISIGDVDIVEFGRKNIVDMESLVSSQLARE